MKKIIANLILAISLVFSFLMNTSAQGLYDNIRIKSVINVSPAGIGKCMDVSNGQTAIGTLIVQFDCNRANLNQRFSIRAEGGGGWIIHSNLDWNKCVGITSNVQANPGEPLRLVACYDSFHRVQPGAVWELVEINGNAQFRSVLPAFRGARTCIDIPSGSSSNSVGLQLYFCHTGGNQQWDFIYPDTIN